MPVPILRRPFAYSYHNAALWLIAANILVFALMQLVPSLGFLLAMNPVSVLSGRVWQLASYLFAHGGLSHLFVNMLGLFFFGTQVEREFGTKEFLLYYFLTGFLAGLFSFGAYLLTGAYGVFLLGASGAVFALLLAYATIFPEAHIYIWGILPVRAPLLVLGYTALEIVSEFTGARSSVAHLTHLAGFGFGWLYFLLRWRVNPARRFFRSR